MKIRLNEIPEEGRQYVLNRNTAELNSSLQDLIKDNPYSVDLFIKPMNTKDLEVVGTLTTTTVEQCSRCAEDFDFKIDKQIREILIPQQETDRTGKYARSSVNISKNEDEAYSVTEYSKKEFDLGEFLHEAIALEVPFNPCCKNCSAQGSDKLFIYDEKMGEETKPNPFQALKGLKLN